MERNMPLVKGVFCLAVFPTICRSHWELVSFYRRDSGFLTSCQHTTVSVHVLFNKMVIFCHSSALVDVLFLRECTAFISYPCVLHNDKMSHFDIMLCPMRRNYKSAQLETNEIIMESPMKESKSSYNKD